MNSSISTRSRRHSRLATSLFPAILIAGLFLGAFTTSAASWISRHNLTGSEYQAEFKKWTGKPHEYRLVSIAGYEKNGQARYAAIWEQRPGPDWVAHHGLTKAKFDSANANYAGQGMQPVFVSAFGVGNQAYYNAIWEHAPDADGVAEVGLSYTAYLVANSIRVAQGYKLTHLWTCNAGSTELFAGIWRKGDPANYQVRIRHSSSQYQQEFDSLSAQGYQLNVVSTAVLGGQSLYTAVWKQPGDGNPGQSYHGLSAMNYQGASWNAYYQGYRPVLTSAFNPSGGERFNVIFRHNGGMSPDHLALINDAIDGYMQSNNIPGLSLAISREGRLVYAQGFGLADQSANQWVHPHHRFRIASVSKPITSAAILKLRDLCGLDLDQTVFGPGALLGETYGNPPYSVQERAITVRQLLQHTTGWTTDGIWQVGSDNPGDAIDWQLADSAGAPTSAPGSFYTYMNIGYAVAGRVIEQRSGRSYEKFVQDELLAPSCVTDMEIGGRTLAERKPNEVVYYQSGGGNPYNLSPSRMDAHGGWIAKPIDLLLFLRRIDSNTNQADLLQPDSLTAMRTPSMAPGPSGGGTNYALGLGVTSGGWGHNGAMSGTLADLTYRNDGIAFAVTCNTRPSDDQFAGVLKATINNLINTLNALDAWPDFDLFPCNVPPGSPPQTMEVTSDLYVDGSSSCPWANGRKDCGFLQGPFPTVNQGVNAVCAGDRLFIRAGSYNEQVFFNRFVTVRSYDGTAIIGK
jgi:CubicO group peptidase (beta-lactamase class C family)